MAMTKAKNIDEFISNYPAGVQEILKKIRQTIREVCPEAGEKIAYGIPTFTFHGNLVHFSAYDRHIGFYPGSAPIAALKDDLQGYETSKGTVRFPLDKPIPYDLIKKMTKLAMERNLEKKHR
jgi:uncharacterized protein YdhG (YjbR/CyaY superfamily)